MCRCQGIVQSAHTCGCLEPVPFPTPARTCHCGLDEKNLCCALLPCPVAPPSLSHRSVTFGPDDVVEMIGQLKAGARPADVKPSRCVSVCVWMLASHGDAPHQLCQLLKCFLVCTLSNAPNLDMDVAAWQTLFVSSVGCADRMRCGACQGPRHACKPCVPHINHDWQGPGPPSHAARTGRVVHARSSLELPTWEANNAPCVCSVTTILRLTT